jgi:hypothetical protein
VTDASRSSRPAGGRRRAATTHRQAARCAPSHDRHASRPRRSRERVPLHPGDGRKGLRSGAMLRGREAPAWAIVPRGASPVPSRRRSVGAGDGPQVRARRASCHRIRHGLLDAALLIDATSMTRVERRHDFVIAGSRLSPPTRRPQPLRGEPVGVLHTHCTLPLEVLVPQGVQGARRLCRPMLACPRQRQGAMP